MGCCGSNPEKTSTHHGKTNTVDDDSPLYPFMGFDEESKPIILPPITMAEALVGKRAATGQQEEALRVMDLKSAPPETLVERRRFRWPSRKMVGNLLTVEADQNLDTIISEESVFVAADSHEEDIADETGPEDGFVEEQAEVHSVGSDEVRKSGSKSSSKSSVKEDGDKTHESHTTLDEEAKSEVEVPPAAGLSFVEKYETVDEIGSMASGDEKGLMGDVWQCFGYRDVQPGEAAAMQSEPTGHAGVTTKPTQSMGPTGQTRLGYSNVPSGPSYRPPHENGQHSMHLNVNQRYRPPMMAHHPQMMHRFRGRNMPFRAPVCPPGCPPGCFGGGHGNPCRGNHPQSPRSPHGHFHGPHPYMFPMQPRPMPPYRHHMPGSPSQRSQLPRDMPSVFFKVDRDGQRKGNSSSNQGNGLRHHGGHSYQRMRSPMAPQHMSPNAPNHQHSLHPRPGHGAKNQSCCQQISCNCDQMRTKCL